MRHDDPNLAPPSFTVIHLTSHATVRVRRCRLSTPSLECRQVRRFAASGHVPRATGFAKGLLIRSRG